MDYFYDLIFNNFLNRKEDEITDKIFNNKKKNNKTKNNKTKNNKTKNNKTKRYKKNNKFLD